jgi:hypothetical protein
VVISSGAGLLSELTAGETEHFKGKRRRSNERLACEARIIKPGDLSIMTEQQNQQTGENGSVKDPLQAEFEALPLDKKIASLLRMEAVTLGETFNYVVNSSIKAVERAGDVIQDLGSKLENEARKATCSTGADPDTANTSATEGETGANADSAKTDAGKKARTSKRGPKAPDSSV